MSYSCSPNRSSESFESRLLEVLSLVVGEQGNVFLFRRGGGYIVSGFQGFFALGWRIEKLLYRTCVSPLLVSFIFLVFFSFTLGGE